MPAPRTAVQLIARHSRAPAALSTNSSPSRMYRASMASEAWPVCCLIFHDETPLAAALGPHPTQDERGHSYSRGEEAPALYFPPESWRENADYLYGVDLYNHGYLWEAHEAWEGLWHKAADCFVETLGDDRYL